MAAVFVEKIRPYGLVGDGVKHELDVLNAFDNEGAPAIDQNHHELDAS